MNEKFDEEPCYAVGELPNIKDLDIKDIYAISSQGEFYL